MHYLAIDIGASSGRHIVGWRENGQLQTKEVYRFPNGVKEEPGHLVWDMEALLREVKQGIRAAKAEFPEIESLSIDTWGVDYVLLRENQEVLPVYAYRDSRTEAVIPVVHGKMSFSAGKLEGVTDLLMIPEYLLYKLCRGPGIHQRHNHGHGQCPNRGV